MVITACTGAVAGSPGFSSVFIASVNELSASLGCALNRERTAPVPWGTGAPGGTDAAATASPARNDASPLPPIGSASRSDPHAGKFNPANAFGLVCSPGSVAQFCLARAGASSGRTASTTGELTSEWLSLIVF